MSEAQMTAPCTGCGAPTYPAKVILPGGPVSAARCDACRNVDAAWRDIIYEQKGTRFTKRPQIREIELAARRQ